MGEDISKFDEKTLEALLLISREKGTKPWTVGELNKYGCLSGAIDLCNAGYASRKKINDSDLNDSVEYMINAKGYFLYLEVLSYGKQAFSKSLLN